jgi:nucleoside-diphosphate-sugar epimerase
MTLSPPASTVLTGATGYLGSLIAASLLASERCRLVLPVREKHSRESVVHRIAQEMEAAGCPVTQEHLDRLIVTPLPPTAEIPKLLHEFRRQGVHEIIHAAGCVEYFNTHSLNLGNLDLTRAFVELADGLRVSRFFYISTAFCSGYRDDHIAEALHAEGGSDPTAYTRSKRDTEALIAGSGVPYVIVRPSVVIGDGRDGHYGGKRYGIYQMWHAAERFMCAAYVDRIYAIAPRLPLHVIHQDAFQAGFLAAYRALQPPAIFHLVSRPETLPTVRDLWDLWLFTCARPQEIHYYDRLADAPMENMSRQQQFLLEFGSVNIDIGTRPWRFETPTLDRMRGNGLQFDDATVETLRVCQARFMADSPKVRAFMEKYGSERSVTPKVIECA